MTIKPLAIKVAAGLIGLGGSIAIGYQGYKAIQNEPKKIKKISNKDRLISEKYTILQKRESDNDNWTNILNSYKTVIEKKSDLKFDNFDGKATNGVQLLQNKCDEALNSEEVTLLNKAKKWCTVPITVSDALKGRRILKTDNNNDSTEDQSDWNEKIKAYTKADNKNKITELTFSNNPISEPSQDNRNAIRGVCKTLNEKKSYEGDYEEAIIKSRDWCTIEQSS